MALETPLSRVWGPDGKPWPCSTRQPGNDSGDTGLPFLSAFPVSKISRAVSRDRAVRSLPLPPAFPVSAFQLVYSLSPGVSLFYMRIIWRHFERVITITRECLGLLNWIYWGFLFFPSLKDSLMGPNQFQTAGVALAGLTRHAPPPSLRQPGGLPGGSGGSGIFPSQAPDFDTLEPHCESCYPCCYPGFKEERREMKWLLFLFL